MKVILNSILDLCKLYKTNINYIEDKIKLDFRRRNINIIETKINLMCCDVLRGSLFSTHYFELIEIIKKHKTNNNIKILNEIRLYLNSIETNNNELKNKICSLSILSE